MSFYGIILMKCYNNSIYNITFYDEDTINNLLKEYKIYRLYLFSSGVNIPNYNNPITYNY